MTEAAPSASTGPLTESQAIEQLTALGMKGQIPEPKDPEELLDDREPGEPAQEEPADDNAQVEGEEFAEAEEDAAPAASADPLVKFDDGTEMPLSEVKRGWLRQQDYTRKTQEVAKSRKEYEAERATFINEKKQVADRLTPLIQQARSIVENPAEIAALNQLREVDPAQYAVKVLEMQNRHQQLQRLEYEQAQLRQQAEAEESERIKAERTEQAEAARNLLIEKIPAAKKDFVGWYKSLGEYVLSEGLPAEMWDDLVDPHAITLVWKAMQYDRATRKTPETKEQLRKAPQPMRPGARNAPVGHAQARQVREANERLTKSGSIEDAIALMKARGVR